MPPIGRLSRPLLVAWAALWLGAPALAAESTGLPEPLTLEYALSLADEPHPDLQLAQAGVDSAKADEAQAESATGWNARLEAQARWVQPPAISPDQRHNDSRVGLVVTKDLYDFGRSEHNVEAAGYDVKSRSLLYLNARQQRRLEIMRRYFDVLLADLQYMRDNEDMAVVYVALDRLRDRRELGQVSDIDVLKKEAAYQRVREKRTQSENMQRATRVRLAIALNRPDDPPSTLAKPKLPWLKRKLPEVEDLQKQALEHNAVIRALRARLAGARERLAAKRAGDRPVLRGRAETFAYNREMGSYDKWQAGVQLEVPLLDGGSVDAAVAKEQAEVYRLQAKLAKTRMDIREAVLNTWLSLQSLKTRRQADRAETDYRDLYLDRSRALYQMEVTTDLGDSMVKISDAELEAARTDFKIAMAWSQLDALTGRLSLDASQALPGAQPRPAATEAPVSDETEQSTKR